MGELVVAAAFFVGIHLLVAGTRLRDVIVGVIGEKAYMGLFSLVSLLGIFWLYWSFRGAPTVIVWVAPLWFIHLGGLLMLIAFLFAAIGLTTPNPTSVLADGLLDDAHVVRGILRVTRHPFLMAVTLWALFHIIVRGDTASIVFFGCFAFLGIFGPGSIDAKRARKMGAQWQNFAAKTSVFPGAAIIAGRNRLVLSEFAVWRIAVGLLAFGSVLFAHFWLFGVSPVPGWVPY